MDTNGSGATEQSNEAESEPTAELRAAATASRLRITGDKGPLFCALAKAQKAFGPIIKSRTVTVKPKENPSAVYTFSYAELSQVLAATLPALNDNGLYFSQPIASTEDGGYRLHTWLCHESGAMIEAETDIPAAESVQKFGSAVTYLRRYVAQALLGVSSEEDDDGNAADGNERKNIEPPRRAPAPSAAKPPAAAPKAAPPADEPTPTDPITAEQDSEIAKLFKALKYSRVAATELTVKVTGKAPFRLERGDADKLLAHLRELTVATEGVAS